ncbi:MAG TPA: hypothetical protein PK339_10690 [Flavitalea sp.]|nr:hypothetical protein [Flavitalea sp.]
MRMIRYFSFCLAALMIFFSCRKETSWEIGDGLPPIEGKWEFTVPGQTYQGPLDSAYIYDYGPYQELFLFGSAPDVEGELILRVIGLEITSGSYPNPAAFFIYGENGAPLFLNDPSEEGAFTLTITSLDSVSVSGTFSGKVLDGLGNEKTLTDGKFTAMLNRDVEQPPQIALGQLTLWSKDMCPGPGEGIKVTVDNQTGFITQSLASEPSCDGEGTTNIVLLAGHYTIKAECGDKIVYYEVDIEENQCTVLEVELNDAPVFTDYFPDTDGSSWVYQDAADTDRTATTVVSSETEQIDGRVYRKFTDLSGATRYYRKEGNEYYEYAALSHSNAVTDPPLIEYTFLKDNAAKNDSWETSAYNLKLSGVTIRGKLRFTIADRDFSQTIAGRQYNNLIAVFTELLVSLDGGSSFTPVSSYTTIYAKGIGVVYTETPDPLTQWELKSYSLNP